ncbi:hypothetical protein ACOSQ4_014194 [Xanthoceras sorbifolium]
MLHEQMIEQLNTVSTLDVIPPSANYVSGLSDRKSQRRGHNNSENGRGMEDLLVGTEEAEANLLSSDSIVKCVIKLDMWHFNVIIDLIKVFRLKLKIHNLEKIIRNLLRLFHHPRKIFINLLATMPLPKLSQTLHGMLIQVLQVISLQT